MSDNIKHFETQTPHLCNGVPCWYVMVDKAGPVEVHHVATTEVTKFLEGTTFLHVAGQIPRFEKPRKQGKWKNPLKKPDVNS